MTRTGPLHVIFACYSGDSPHYLESLYAPQLIRLAARGVRVSVASFESRLMTPARRARLRERFESSGITWRVLPYHRRPTVAKLLDLVIGVFVLVMASRTNSIVHARSHMCGAMALPARILGRGRLVFDLDGALPDEYVDAGRWSRRGPLYLATKAVERWLLRSADAVIVRTESQRARMSARGFSRVRLIRHGIDVAAFHQRDSGTKRAERQPVIVYSGNADPHLYRLKEMAAFVAALRRFAPHAHLLFLAVAGTAVADVERALRDGGLPADAFTVRVGVPSEEMAPTLACASAGLAFRDLPSTAHVISPVKVAEYLAVGLPVVTHIGIGDLTQIIETTRTGVVLGSLDAAALDAGAKVLLDLMSEDGIGPRCRRAAEMYFGLERAVGELEDLYRHVAGA